RANASLLQRRGNSTPDVVDLVGGVVELQVGNRPRRRTDVLAVHLEDEADERLGRGEQAHDLGMLVGQLRSADFDETDVIRPCLEAQAPQPLRIEWRRRRRVAGARSLTKSL